MYNCLLKETSESAHRDVLNQIVKQRHAWLGIYYRLALIVSCIGAGMGISTLSKNGNIIFAAVTPTAIIISGIIIEAARTMFTNKKTIKN